MITFHSIVRGFASGEWQDTQTKADFDWGRVQRNAIRSWQAISNDVILFGLTEPGAPEAAHELGCRLYKVERNHLGIPLVRDPIEQVKRLDTHSIRCLVNADVILPGKFKQAVENTAERFHDFLLSARRCDVHVDDIIDFSTDWWPALNKKCQESGKLQGVHFLDVFFYRGNWLTNMPPFAVGRARWDNWIVWKAMNCKIPIIDGTRFVTCIHQAHPKARVKAETRANIALYNKRGGCRAAGTLTNATHLLTGNGEVARK